jgi:hypothetical protein
MHGCGLERGLLKSPSILGERAPAVNTNANDSYFLAISLIKIKKTRRRRFIALTWARLRICNARPIHYAGTAH